MPLGMLQSRLILYRSSYNPIFSAPLLSPADVKKLIEKRNERFQLAVDEYLFKSLFSRVSVDDPLSLG